jgi:dephospho-CoA kinase
MIIVGVTGAIGSGKSTLCKVWEELGAKVVYADHLAKELMVNNAGLRSELKSAFGEETYAPDGSLNREHLIREAFEKGRVQELNDIVHPQVAQSFKEICKNYSKQEGEMIVEEAALLLNQGRPEIFDSIVIVKSERQKRLERVVRRDQVTVEEVISRAERQPDFNQLSHLADYIIENNGSLSELKKKSKDLYYRLIREEER